ncbi:hypothetical protein ACWCWD_15570 [Streptomyces sp. NPDC001493]
MLPMLSVMNLSCRALAAFAIEYSFAEASSRDSPVITFSALAASADMALPPQSSVPATALSAAFAAGSSSPPQPVAPASRATAVIEPTQVLLNMGSPSTSS